MLYFKIWILFRLQVATYNSTWFSFLTFGFTVSLSAERDFKTLEHNWRPHHTWDMPNLSVFQLWSLQSHPFLVEIRPAGVGQTSDSLVQPFLVFLEGPFLTVRVGLNVKVDLCLRSPEKWYQIQELIYEKCFPKMSLATIYDLNCLWLLRFNPPQSDVKC